MSRASNPQLPRLAEFLFSSTADRAFFQSKRDVDESANLDNKGNTVHMNRHCKSKVMNETEDTHPEKSIPLAAILLFNNTALAATMKN